MFYLPGGNPRLAGGVAAAHYVYEMIESDGIMPSTGSRTSAEAITGRC